MADVSNVSGSPNIAGINAPKKPPVDPQIHQEFEALDTQHKGVITKDQLVASQTEGVANPQDKQKLADEWGHVYDQFASKGGLHEDEFASLVSGFTNDFNAKAPAKDDFLSNVGIYEENLRARISDLDAFKADTTKDLADPKRAPEAQARLQLIDQQIGILKDTLGQTEGLRQAYHAPRLDLNDPNVAKDPVLKNQAILERNLTERAADLIAAKNDVIKDLSDPRKQAEAFARMGQLDAQIAGLESMQNKANAYNKPANLSPEQAKTTMNILADMNDMAKDLSDPRVAGDAPVKYNALSQLLNNPKLYDPDAEYFTKDPVLLNQAITSHNLHERFQELAGMADGLIGDLADPKKAPEAEARLNQIFAQMGQLNDVNRAVSDYKRPTDLTETQVKAKAETIAQVNYGIKDLFDPQKSAAAHDRLRHLFDALK